MGIRPCHPLIHTIVLIPQDKETFQVPSDYQSKTGASGGGGSAFQFMKGGGGAGPSGAAAAARVCTSNLPGRSRSLLLADSVPTAVDCSGLLGFVGVGGRGEACSGRDAAAAKLAARLDAVGNDGGFGGGPRPTGLMGMLQQQGEGQRRQKEQQQQRLQGLTTAAEWEDSALRDLKQLQGRAAVTVGGDPGAGTGEAVVVADAARRAPRLGGGPAVGSRLVSLLLRGGGDASGGPVGAAVSREVTQDQGAMDSAVGRGDRARGVLSWLRDGPQQQPQQLPEACMPPGPPGGGLRPGHAVLAEAAGPGRGGWNREAATAAEPSGTSLVREAVAGGGPAQGAWGAAERAGGGLAHETHHEAPGVPAPPHVGARRGGHRQAAEGLHPQADERRQQLVAPPSAPGQSQAAPLSAPEQLPAAPPAPPPRADPKAFMLQIKAELPAELMSAVAGMLGRYKEDRATQPFIEGVTQLLKGPATVHLLQASRGRGTARGGREGSGSECRWRRKAGGTVRSANPRDGPQRTCCRQGKNGVRSRGACFCIHTMQLGAAIPTYIHT